jgi:uncharacterized protein YukE
VGTTMAHDFGASYEAMEAMAKKLDQGKEDISGILDDLKNAVEDLLGEDFKTEQASGKFGEGYNELDKGLKTAIEGVSDMGEALRNMITAIQDTDSALAGS